MEELLAYLPEWVKLIPDIFTGLVIIATVVVRFTPSPKDDEVTGKALKIVLGTLHRFPTLGINPETKRLKKALEELQK